MSNLFLKKKKKKNLEKYGLQNGRVLFPYWTGPHPKITPPPPPLRLSLSVCAAEPNTCVSVL